jgi:hypothetical protein
VFLSGISVPDREVLDLARRLRATGFDEEAEKLEDAHRREVRILALEIAEREAILRALEECPDGSLAELRATILRDVTWFRQQGLAYRLDGSLDPSCGEHRPRPMAGVARAASPNTDGAEGPRIAGPQGPPDSRGTLVSGGPVRRRFAVFRPGEGRKCRRRHPQSCTFCPSIALEIRHAGCPIGRCPARHAWRQRQGL